MMKCKTCSYFKRNHLHKSLTKSGEKEPLLSGYCKMLKDILLITNSILWREDNLYVQESFGCVLHREGGADEV